MSFLSNGCLKTLIFFVCYRSSRLCALNPFIFTSNPTRCCTVVSWCSTILSCFSFYFCPFLCSSFMRIFSSTCSLKYSVFNWQLFMLMVSGIIYIMITPRFLEQTHCWALGISSWVSYRSLKHHVSKVELNFLPLKSFSSFLYLSGVTVYCFPCAGNTRIIFYHFSLCFFPLPIQVLFLLVFTPLVQQFS